MRMNEYAVRGKYCKRVLCNSEKMNVRALHHINGMSQ